MKKIISICIVLMIFVVAFASCAPSVDDVVGTYKGSYTYNGNEFYVVITLESNGTYKKVTEKNGAFSSSESGAYEIKGKTIRLYDSDTLLENGSWEPYEYSDGVLTNNNREFKK